MSPPLRLLRTSNRAVKFSTLYFLPAKHFATVQTGTKHVPGVWFNGSSPSHIPASLGLEGDRRSPDERTLKLGKTLRTLQPLLPTLLQSPLPTRILSPQITLHLFPSTHPHLPTVSGRVAYVAALWTSPLAWGRVPIVGNVRLEILSERMVRKSSSDSPIHYGGGGEGGYRSEQLVVRWRTVGKSKSAAGKNNRKGMKESSEKQKVAEALGQGAEDKEFTGLFIFEFDEQGRIVSHTIEHVQEGGNWEKGVGARVVGLTDWLLGGMKGNEGTGEVCPAICSEQKK